MKPLHVGFVNPSHDNDAEDPQRRRKLYLTEDNLVTHIHGLGATRSGKSKWLEYFCRQLIRQGTGFTLIDPQGKLSEDIIRYLAYYYPYQKVIYFHPSRTDHLIPFNPFIGGSEDDYLDVKVLNATTGILRAWGAEDSDGTPRLSKWLQNVLPFLVSGLIKLKDVPELLRFAEGDNAYRKALTEELRSLAPEIAISWDDLNEIKRLTDFRSDLESTESRLQRFYRSKQLRRIMSHHENTLDFREVFDENVTVICNLSDSGTLHEDNAKVLGTLIISELWAAAKRYTSKPHDYFLFVDEVENFLSPDLKHILDRGAGKGLHLGIFHQHLDQLKRKDSELYSSVMGNAKIKLAFGGLTKQNALALAEEMFPDQLPYDEIKFTLEQTKFWPVYGRDQVYSSSSSRGRGEGTSANEAMSQGLGYALGASDGSPEGFEGLPAIDPIRLSVLTSRGEGQSSSDFYSEAEGVSDIPIYRPVPFKETSSVQLYTIGEQYNRIAESIMVNLQRHFFIRVPGLDTMAAVTPFVKDYRVTEESFQEYVFEELLQPLARQVAEIDVLLASKTSFEGEEEPPSFEDEYDEFIG